MASKENFKPGLFDLGLNIEKKLKSHYLNIDRKNLVYYLKSDPIYIKPATRNLIALFLFHVDLGRTRARLMLEKLTADCPDELNALADLIYVYKKMGRKKDAVIYTKKLESHKDNPLFQARSILGQAYALTYDLADDHNKTPKAFLKDSWRMLNMEDNHTEQVIKANTLIVEAYKVLNAIPETAYEKKIKAKQKAIEKFEEGIKKLEELKSSKEEISTWRHKLAVARVRMDTWRGKRGDDIHVRSENCIKAMEDYVYMIDSLESVENLEEPLKLYLAKSYIFLAQLYESRKNYIKRYDLSENVKKKIRDVDLLVGKARQLCPNNKTILTRYGRIKINNKKNLEAINVCSKSIELLPDKDINWFAYATRREAFYHYSRELIRKQSHKEEIDKYLRLAYSDAEICLQSKCAEFDMLQMAEICFERAVPVQNPVIWLKCEKIDFMHEALDLLHEALNIRDINKDPRIHALCGKCYLYINEYRKSIESIKTSLKLNKWNIKYPKSFTHLSISFMCFYYESKNINLLSEFRYILKDAKKRRCDDWVTEVLRTMYDYFQDMLYDLIINMINWDARGCEDIVNEVLSNGFWVPYYMINKFRKRLRQRYSHGSDINRPAEIQVLESRESFEYDFFVLHSEEDKDWVNFMLQPQLEDYDDAINFEGCFPSRDFKPGMFKTESILNAINKCRKVLIILTPNNCRDKSMTYFSHISILSMIESKIKEKMVIAIVLKSCTIPDVFQHNNVLIDFTQKSDWDQLRMALTANMDSMLELEKKMSNLRCFDPDEVEN